MQRNVLGHLTPRQLVGCMQVSRFYNKFIQETPSLNQSVQHGKYLLLAKQTAELIPDARWKQKAYCAIATLEAKSNPEEAKQTLRLAKQTAEQIQENHLKSIAYCAIAAALLPQ